MIDLLLHADEQLALWATEYGFIVYGILFLIIFAETGLVVTPFLPGDSLLFAPARWRDRALVDLLSVILARHRNGELRRGPTTGSRRGTPARPPRQARIRAGAIFPEARGKAVVLARFVPIVRTFLPFVAGGAQMPYRSFMFYNVTGCVLWVGICTGAGYLFGNIPVVKENFELVVLGIIGVSVLPIVYEVVRSFSKREASA
jgi:membrane-associated protein